MINNINKNFVYLECNNCPYNFIQNHNNCDIIFDNDNLKECLKRYKLRFNNIYKCKICLNLECANKKLKNIKIDKTFNDYEKEYINKHKLEYNYIIHSLCKNCNYKSLFCYNKDEDLKKLDNYIFYNCMFCNSNLSNKEINLKKIN